MEMFCDWNAFVAFHAGEVQATCAISSLVDLQNLLATTIHMVLRVVFNLKTKPTPPSRLHSKQQKSQTSTTLLKTSLEDHLCLVCSEAEWRAGNQCWERGEETISYRSWTHVARQQKCEDLLNSLVCWWLKLIVFKICSTHWSCEGSSNPCSFSAQLKSWLNYKAYIPLQVLRLFVLSSLVLRRQQQSLFFLSAVEILTELQGLHSLTSVQVVCIELLLSAFYIKPLNIQWNKICEFINIHFMYEFITKI